MPPPTLRPCVIVADDNDGLRYLTTEALRSSPHADAFDIEEADNGVAALALVTARVAAGARVLLLSDNRMPGMTGAELVVRAREAHPGAALRAVVLTSAEPPRETRDDLARHGVTILVRPFGMDELRKETGALVAEWLAGRAA